MVTMYLDSAIIVKLLVREADSEWFSAHLTGHKLNTSELALTEVRSAFLSKERSGQIPPRQRVMAAEKFLSLVESGHLRLLPLDRAVLDRAAAIQQACHPQIPLRTLDAIHVATCDLHRGGKMCATDGRMRAACGQLGLALMPEKTETLPAPG
jgi:predicted nucleic acid-binding protein